MLFSCVSVPRHAQASSKQLPGEAPGHKEDINKRDDLGVGGLHSNRDGSYYLINHANGEVRGTLPHTLRVPSVRTKPSV